MARLYRLLLDDYSSPSFISSMSAYYGTLDQVKGLFDDLRSDKKTAEKYTYILSVLERYLAGETKITHNVAYQEVPFLVRAKVLATEKSVQTDFKWTHYNTWDCPYYMKCDKAESTHLWIVCHKRYMRCIQTRFTNIQYGLGENDYEPLGGMIWGYPGQIQGKPGNIFNQLYVGEKWFENKQEAMEDHEKFLTNPDPAYASIVDDVFGDG